MSQATPDLETVIESDDPELAEQYNEAKREELREKIDQLRAEEREAFEMVADAADKSLTTTKVEIPGGHTLSVRSRTTRRAEQLASGIQADQPQDIDLDEARAATAQFLDEMVTDDGFTEDMWLAAFEANSVGFGYLAEVVTAINEEVQPQQGNANPSGGRQSPTEGKQSGPSRRR